MENNIIIFSCNEYPGYGGAATNTYALVKYFYGMNFNVNGIFYNNTNHNVDLDGIDKIIKLPAPDIINLRSILNYKYMIDDIIKGYPRIIFSKNYYVLQLNHILYPKAKHIYLAGGIPQFSEIPGNVKEFLSFNNTKFHYHKMDLDSYNKSDLIIANSLLSHQIILKLYPQFKDKIYKNPMDTTKCIISLFNETNTDLKAKKWDFIIIVSNMKRKVKNNFFLFDILKDSDFNRYSKIIIGNSSAKFKEIQNVHVHDLLPHSEVCKYLKQSKVLLFPSLFDSNPNTVREAIYFKCLVLTTDTIGFYDRFPNISICKNFNKTEWKEKALHLINNYDSIIKNYSIDFSMEEDFDDFVYDQIEN